MAKKKKAKTLPVWKHPRARLAAIGVFATAAAFFVFRGSAGTTQRDPIDVVPKESFLVGTADVAELRKSPIYDVVLGNKSLGLGDLEAACGFDPFTRVDRMALAVPEKEGERDYGIIARVSVSRDELATCKKHLDEKRGTSGSEAKERGDFVVIEGVQAGSTKGRLAYGAGNLLIVSTGTWFDTILDVANGKAEGVKEGTEHADLRASLTSREGWRAPTILVTAILPRSLRDRIRKEMAGEADREDKENTMASVLGVASLGVAVKAGPPGGHLDARVEMRCDSPGACQVVEKLVLKKRLDWSRNFMYRLAGFGQAIDSIETKVDGARLSISATANVDSLAGAVDKAIKHSKQPDERPLPPPALPPHEVMKLDANPSAEGGGAPRSGDH